MSQSTSLSVFSQELPDFLKDAQPSELTRSLVGNTSKRLSIRGGVFRMIVGGEEVRKSDGRSLNVIVVNAAPRVSRIFYEQAYNPSNITPPDCFSSDGKQPDASIENPQSDMCATCPQNIKGSSRDGKSRACGYQQRLAVMIVGDPTNDVYQLTLPSRSIFSESEGDYLAFPQYVKLIIANGRSLEAMITELSFDTDSATPKLTFKPVKVLEKADALAAIEQGKTDFAIKAITMTVSEADNAKQLTEAIAPFAQELQSQNISPAAWINNLGRAHMILAKAPYEQKVQMFQKLASDYGIQFNGESVVSAPQADAYTQQLMNQLNQVNQEVSSIKGRFAQEENQRLMNEIEKYRSDVEKYPHFDKVREEMAQLLEFGKAQDLETAYKKAVRMNDDVWSLEQERLLSDAKQKALKAQQVAKAKSAAVLPKSTTPSGSVVSGEKKDRRALIAEQLGEATNRL